MSALSSLQRRPRLAQAETARAVRDDSAAFARIYQRHHQALYRYCRSILQHDEDARDALQNTFEKAFTALRTEERDFELKPWLFRIAHNEAISLVRRRRETSDLDVATDIGDDSLPQRVDEREDLRQLREDLAELPERQRAALVLRELSGLSHEEIATTLETTPKAVKAAIFEGRSALQVCREGRAMACEDIRRVLSDGDGRARRGRALRAHLRTCSGCRDFQRALQERPGQLAALAPPLPAAAGAALLAHLLPGAKGLVGGVGAAGAGAGGAGVAGGLAAKVTVVAVIGATAAGGAVAVRHHESRSASPPARQAAPAAVSPPAAPHRATPIVPARSATSAPLPSALVARGHAPASPAAVPTRHARGNSSSGTHGAAAHAPTRAHGHGRPFRSPPASAHHGNRVTHRAGDHPARSNSPSGQSHSHKPKSHGSPQATNRPRPTHSKPDHSPPPASTVPHEPAHGQPAPTPAP